MDKFKTNWQLTETVKPEDFNRIEGNIKENDTELSRLEEHINLELNKRDKEINKKSQKSDVILKVEIPSDRDCNSFKSLNSFCAFDTMIGDFKNTPEGTLPIGSAKVFIITNRGYSNGRIQQEFTYLYPKERVTKWVRNYDSDENEKWGKWYKVYDEANKPTADDLGVSPNNHNHDSDYIRKRATRIVGKDLNEIIDGGYYAIVQHEKPCPNIPVGSDGYLMVIPWSGGQWCTQIFINDIEGDMHIRTNNISSNGMSWSKWAKLYDTNNKPTPGEIGAYSKDETDNKFKVKDATVFTLQDSYVAVRTSNRKPNQYYEFWDTNSGWADLKCNDVFVGQGKNKVYHSGNRPTPSDIGAVSKSGDDISGTLKFKSAGNEIEIFNSGSTQHARGVVYKNDSNVITGMVGSLLNGQNAEKMFIGNTSEPWSGVNSLTVDKSGCYYNNQKIYHKGNKPSLGELGAEGKSDSFSRRGEINNTTNWNSLIEPGCYKVQMGNWGAASTNAPLQGYSFGLLMVYRTAVSSEDRIHQVYVPHKTNEAHWHRMCNAGSWQGWYPVDVRDSADSRYFTKSEDISVANGKRVITSNNYGLMGKLTDGNADYMMYMGADNRIKLGYNKRGIDINGPVSINGYGINDNGKGERRNCLAVIKSDSVMEVGQFIDFHATGTNDDFTIRAEAKTDHSLNFWGGYKITADGTPLQKQVQQSPLWSGAHYMGKGQNVWPSRNLTDCQNGWILVWSDYDQGPNNANDYNWCYSYIPKNSPANGKTQNQFFQVSTNENGDMTVKGLIIYNNRIDGVDPTGNAQSSGKWHDVVLRYVLEY